jgi:hypothetical protein
MIHLTFHSFTCFATHLTWRSTRNATNVKNEKKLWKTFWEKNCKEFFFYFRYLLLALARSTKLGLAWASYCIPYSVWMSLRGETDIASACVMMLKKRTPRECRKLVKCNHRTYENGHCLTDPSISIATHVNKRENGQQWTCACITHVIYLYVLASCIPFAKSAIPTFRGP